MSGRIQYYLFDYCEMISFYLDIIEATQDGNFGRVVEFLQSGVHVDSKHAVSCSYPDSYSAY
jgi:hypothetical protein